MIDWILLSIGFVAIFAGTISDIKTREVPDYATYGLIFSALGIRLLYATATFNWMFLLEGVLGFILFFILACALFYLGQWGGGDAKLFMGVGAVFGFQLQPFHNALGFILNLLIIGGAYGLVWSLVLAIKHRKKISNNMGNLLQKKEVVYGKFACYIIALLLAIFGFYLSNPYINIPIFALAITTIVAFYAWILMKSLETCCFHKRVDVDKLTEGDWILREIHIDGRYIAGPKDLGITKKQMRQLKEFKKENKIKTITIKEGLPFVPSFFIAYGITIIWGNLILLLI